MKTLIISHNPVSTHQNMGKTMLSLFDVFSPEELCQLYIYPSVPDTDKCSSYFRVTDKDILRSYYRFRVNSGEVLPRADFHEMFVEAGDEKLYRSRKNKTALRKLIRDLMWKCSRWYNKELRTWLDKEKPNCIFIAPGEAKFIYDVALKISKEYRIPLVVYICDDYYFVEKGEGLLASIQQKLLHKKMEQLFSRTSHIITICNELRDLYAAKFGIPSTTIMTGTAYPIAEAVSSCARPRSITYMGNIRCRRFMTLAEIGNALDLINEKNGTNYSLKIYSAENDPSILSVFDGIRSIELCGFVGGAEFDRVFHSAELLLHTESFHKISMDFVKHSISTKIADSLGSGIPLIAYGPDCVSSMKHLVSHDCAIIIRNRDQLEQMLLRAFEDGELRAQVAGNALHTGRECHVSQINSQSLYRIMEHIAENTAQNK